MMDVIEEMGFDVSHRCYWDFGRWSDLCRVWRQAGDDLQPEELLNFEVSLSYSLLAVTRQRHGLCLALSLHKRLVCKDLLYVPQCLVYKLVRWQSIHVHPVLTCHAMQAVLSRNGTYEDSVRWARCLSEIVKQAGQLCNESATAAYVEVSSRLQVSKALPLSTNGFWEDACHI